MSKISCHFCDSEAKLPYNFPPDYTNCKLVCRSPVGPTRNKNCLWQPCLLTDQDEMHNLYRGPSIDVSYQVHLAMQYQRRKLKLEKLTDHGRQVMAKAHIAFGKIS